MSGIYFNSQGNPVQEKPASEEAWSWHWHYQKAFDKTSPENRKKVTDEVRELLAQNKRKKFEKFARSAFLRNGGSPAAWPGIKDVLIASAIEASTRDSLMPLLQKKRNPTGF